MTTLDLETESLLKAQAGRLGQDADTLAASLRRDILERVDHDFDDSCAAVAEALASDPADDISLEDYRAQFEAARVARRAAAC